MLCTLWFMQTRILCQYNNLMFIHKLVGHLKNNSYKRQQTHLCVSLWPVSFYSEKNEYLDNTKYFICAILWKVNIRNKREAGTETPSTEKIIITFNIIFVSFQESSERSGIMNSLLKVDNWYLLLSHLLCDSQLCLYDWGGKRVNWKWVIVECCF